MNRKLLIVAISLALSATAGYAHHPAEDNENMPEGTWETIDENVADTPHADMTFDDMGGAMQENESSGDEANSESRGGSSEGSYQEAREERGEDATQQATANKGETASKGNTGRGDDRQYQLERQTGEGPGDADDSVDTFDLLENVVSAID